MDIKRVLSIAMSATVLFVGAHFAYDTYLHIAPPQGIRGWNDWADQVIAQKLDQNSFFKQLAPKLMLAAGVGEQDGIFITQQYLLENIKPGDPAIIDYNIAQIKAFSENNEIAASVMLIPTAVAVKQQLISATAQIYNQKALINQVYDELSGSVSTIDCYSSLFSAKDQYTYYRTESNLTGLGGYYVYNAMASRLGFVPRGLNQFEIEHLGTDYYGELFDRCGYKGTPPDIITLYNFMKFQRQYMVKHTLGEESKVYYSLFPRHLEQISKPTDVILGGFSPRVDVSIVSPYEQSLLLFADKTVMSYLPFLLVHFGDITVIDLDRLTEQEVADIDIGSYGSVIFAFSVDSFINSPVCKNADSIAP